MEVSFVLERNHDVGQLLVIQGYDVGLYPISYMIDECLEDFCYSWGWELDSQESVSYNLYISGHMWVDRIINRISSRGVLLAAEIKYNHECI